MDPSLSLLSSISGPSIMLVKQEALAREKYLKNSIAKDICVVAKTLPFVVELGCTAPVNFHGATIVATLCYDNEFNADFKPVDFVKSQPMNYKCFVSEDGMKCTAETRITALSSQHEDALFRVKFNVDFAETENAGIIIFTEPMRVVSKPSQVFKQKRARKTSESPVAPSSPQTSSPPSTPPSTSNAISGKRSASEVSSNGNTSSKVVENSVSNQTLEMLLATVNRLAKQQAELFNLFAVQRNPVAEIGAGSSSQKSTSERSLESAFEEFVSAYDRVPIEDRPSKIRRVVETSNSGQKFMEIVRTCSSGASLAGVPSAGVNTEECLCANCPHKRELSSWDRLYEEFLHSPEQI